MDLLAHLVSQDGPAREAAEWYVSLVPGARIEPVVENGAAGATASSPRPAGAPSRSTARYATTPTSALDAGLRALRGRGGGPPPLFGRIASGGDVKLPVGDHGFSSYLGWATDCHGVSGQIAAADRDLAPWRPYL
ncbi:MAG TPA: hypothetical protein VFB42_12545 [Gaiellaceae bacterium]|nr:hypothetical protein [Gaiellaceae bacterium]